MTMDSNDTAAQALSRDTAETASAQAVPSLDLATMDLRPGADAGAELSLVHPVTGVELGVTLHVLGADSPRWRDALRKVRDAVAQAPQAEPRDEESQTQLRLARNAACAVTGWSTGESPTLRFNGADMPFSYEAALTVMMKLTWITDQVSGFRDRRANFFKP